MRAMSEAIEGARDFRGMMDRLLADDKRVRAKLADRGESVQGNPPPLGMVRQQRDPKDARRSMWVPLYNVTQREATNSPEDSYLNSRGLAAAGAGS